VGVEALAVGLIPGRLGRRHAHSASPMVKPAARSEMERRDVTGVPRW
jgi:hypothetical protein